MDYDFRTSIKNNVKFYSEIVKNYSGKIIPDLERKIKFSYGKNKLGFEMLLAISKRELVDSRKKLTWLIKNLSC